MCKKRLWDRWALSCLAIVVSLGCNPIRDGIAPPKNGNTYVIAHRGVHTDFPENSLAAYNRAINLGCDFVEIDVRTTKDGKLVSVHNKTIDTYFQESKGKVEELTLSELRKEFLLNPDGSPSAEFVPTFEEILALCKGRIGIYLDLKEADIQQQIDLIRKYHMERSTVWYIPISRKEEIQLLGKLCAECLVMPDVEKSDNLTSAIDSIEPKFIASDMGQISDTFIRTCHIGNAIVFVDDNKASQEEWQKLMAWGVDGIQTDSPKQLIHFLKGSSGK